VKTVAIYGKGGIGKSTIASNISAALAFQGMRVLQVGCDPKHDSTLLLTGRPIVPILEMDEKEVRARGRELAHVSPFGVRCIEIGGPQPGIGCAGRGILRGMDMLEAVEVFRDDYDVVIFDVLGDVVCGGFFAPLKKHANEMYIVTSGEFNSLFAANNLTRGYLNNALGNVSLGGIIGNCRGNPNEERVVSQFARRVGAPLVGVLPKDDFVERCTFERIPLLAKDPSHPTALAIARIAGAILRNEGVRTASWFELNDLREFYRTVREAAADAHLHFNGAPARCNEC